MPSLPPPVALLSRRSISPLILFATICFLSSAIVAQTLPKPDHIVIVVEENHSFGQIIGESEAPYLNSLLRKERYSLHFSRFITPVNLTTSSCSLVTAMGSQITLASSTGPSFMLGVLEASSSATDSVSKGMPKTCRRRDQWLASQANTFVVTRRGQILEMCPRL